MKISHFLISARVGLATSGWIVASALSAQASVDQASLTLRIEVPSVSGQTCAAHSTFLGAQLAAQTGATVSKAECTGVHPSPDATGNLTTDTVVLTYTSEHPINPNFTYVGGFVSLNIPQNESGIYPTFAACVGDTANQEAKYKSATGLPVFITTCTSPSTYGPKLFLLTIESFGSTHVHLYGYNEEHIIQNKYPGAFASALRAIIAEGGEVAYQDGSRIYYYAESSILIRTALLGSFRTQSDCEQQVNMAQNIFTHFKARSVSAFCMVSFGYNVLTVVAVNASRIESLSSEKADSYHNINECIADIPRVISNYQAQGANLPGGICTPVWSVPAPEHPSFKLDIYVGRL